MKKPISTESSIETATPKKVITDKTPVLASHATIKGRQYRIGAHRLPSGNIVYCIYFMKKV
jgi:hypothetical protein